MAKSELFYLNEDICLSFLLMLLRLSIFLDNAIVILCTMSDFSHFVEETFVVFLQEFEDLDEILARHIQPMASLAREVFAHKYFLEGVKAEDRQSIETYLVDEKKRTPSRIP